MAIDSLARDERPLIMHVVYRFDTGGLENGLVNLLNHLPVEIYRHVVVALTEVTEFHQRVVKGDVEFIALHKGPGHGVWLYPRLFALMRRLRPAVVHTRNLAALEAVVPAWLAGVPVRLHGEHGRDVGDLDGSNRKYQLVRRLYRPFVSHYVALSRDLADYLVERVGVPSDAVTQVCNGVDVARFRPAAAHAGPAASALSIPDCPFDPALHWMVGTVGRMQAVKDQTGLVLAFLRALELDPALRSRLRLVIAGDGPLRAQCVSLLAAAGVSDLAWLPGERRDVPDLMRGLHCFVLPSLAEGISNTILEAMACGLPVIATAVGGNADLVVDGTTGLLVPPADVPAIASAISKLALEPERATAMGRAGRARAEANFSLQTMVASYRNLYDRHLARVRPQLQGA
jgi:sugar transferase (PEP-CTERM/EpsH1 system associated)